MFALRCTISKTLQTNARQKFLLRQSTPSTLPSLSPSSSILRQSKQLSTEPGQEQTETGIVKFWKTKQAFGIIISDIDRKDLFVHRTNIEGAPPDDIINPVLKRGERVKFRRVIEEKDNEERCRADGVIFENGDKIPVYRDTVSLHVKS